MPDQDLDNLLAQICEHLKRHEKAVLDLTVDVEALKACLPAEQRPLFDEAAAKARFECTLGFETTVRVYDEIIRRFRNT